MKIIQIKILKTSSGRPEKKSLQKYSQINCLQPLEASFTTLQKCSNYSS